MPLAEFTALLVLATAMSFTPGPNTTLSTALAANRGLPHAMRFVCAVLWLAWKLAHSARLTEANTAQLTVGFWQGTALQFVNIKAWLLALTIVAGWVAGRADALQRLAVVLPVMVLFAFTSNLVYAATGALLRQWLAQGSRLLWFNRGMALVLVLTAAWMTTA